MYIRKATALVSATLFLTSFTVLPALAIINQPAQQLTKQPVIIHQEQPVVSVLTQPFKSPRRQTGQDDAELAALVVEPVHPAAVDNMPEPTPTISPTPVPSAAKAAPTPAPELAAPDLAQPEEALSRSQSDLSSNSQSGSIVKMPWYGEAESVYAKGDIAIVLDLETGMRLQIQRTGGHNPADVETINTEETAKLLKVAGGEWNWTRRPIIVEIDGQRIAASMTCRPHAGLDNQPALETVRNRSGGFGTGVNYDSVKGNDMDGHIDIHFYKSRTHGTNQVDSQHQTAIEIAFKSGL